jgi:hypothetical protein
VTTAARTVHVPDELRSGEPATPVAQMELDAVAPLDAVRAKRLRAAD